MPIDNEVWNIEDGEGIYRLRRVIRDDYVTLELRHVDWYQADSIEFGGRSPEDFVRPVSVVLARAIIFPGDRFFIFSMGDKYPSGIPIYKDELKYLKMFFDQVEAERCHAENIEESPIELEVRNLLGTNKE